MKYLALTALLLAGTANAQDITTPLLGQNPMLQNDLGMTVSAKVGLLEVGLAKKPLAIGAVVGYQYTQNFGAEAEYIYAQKLNYTTSEGVVHKKDGNPESTPRITPVRYTTEAGTLVGVYGTYRYHLADDSPLYVKGKLGLGYSNVKGKRVYDEIEVKDTADANGQVKRETIKQPLVSDITRGRTGLAMGLAAGYRMGDLALEAEYTRLDKDSALMSAGATMRF